MGWAKTGMAGILFVAMTAGCQNKLYDQNKELMDENKALRDQNDSMRRQQSQAPPPTAQQQPMVPSQALGTNPPPANTTPKPVVPSTPKTVEQIGGLETTVNQTTGDTTVHLPSDVFFDPGQATLKQTSKASLDKVVTALKAGKFATKRITVEGHTDSTPIRVSKWTSNQQLSEARADAVKEYLVSKGIPTTRITIKGYGDTKPRSTDLSKNRRVEIVVLAAQ
ncbi:MAG TPA: OmpA family protein [Tepidisphaeraceae bacterium]|jgi:outer membrane protein OmpA-like peptidoglycan-associated protein